VAHLILQQERTLDDVLKSSVETFENGCNYRLVKESDGLYYLELGCYGVHPYLLTGDKRLLYNWFSEINEPRRKLSGVAEPETILYLLSQKPCKICGGARFKG